MLTGSAGGAAPGVIPSVADRRLTSSSPVVPEAMYSFNSPLRMATRVGALAMGKMADRWPASSEPLLSLRTTESATRCGSSWQELADMNYLEVLHHIQKRLEESRSPTAGSLCPHLELSLARDASRTAHVSLGSPVTKQTTSLF